MRKIFHFKWTSLLLVLFFVCSVKPGFAQEAPINFFAIKYFKVSTNYESEFIRAQLEAWKKIHSSRIEGEGLSGWYFFRVVSPAGTATEYNYLTIEVYDGPEAIAGHFDGYGVDYTGLLAADEISLALRTPEISEMKYEEVWRSVDQMLNLDSATPYRYQVFNAMKLRPGVEEADYQRMERDYWKPMHEKRMKMGSMKGWGLYTMIIPGGTEREYHWATVDFYDQFIDYLKPTDGIMESIHGKKNTEKYFEETISKRDLLKSEIRELIDFVSVTSMGL